jgi:hypothetical protein
MVRTLRSSCLSRVVIVMAALLSGGETFAAPAAQVGELVRLTRGETLRFEEKNYAQAAKGQEFTLLKAEPGTVHVGYMKEDGSWIAVTVPSDAVEPAPPQPWQDLLNGVIAFRDQRYEATRTLLARAAQDKEQQALTKALLTRINGALTAAGQARNPTAAARQALVTTTQSLRDAAEQLAGAGRVSLAAALNQGVDRLVGNGLGAALPASKVDQANLAERAAVAERCYFRARQSAGAKRLIEAQRFAREGIAAEAAHPGLKALMPSVKRGIEEAEELFETANKMRRFEKGAVHALSAIDDGLKICGDHPRLRALRTEMSAQFEERTSPQVTSAFLAASKVTTSREDLQDGRRLYTNRCAECHELEMLDSRSVDGWDRMVSSMARRANLTGVEKSRIMQYLAAAVKVVEASGP